MAPPTAPIVVRPQPRTLRATWAFVSGNDQCVATAAAGPTAVRVTIRRDAAIRLAVTLPANPTAKPPVPLRFDGPAGRWQVFASPVGGRQLAAVLGSDNDALTRVLVLLSGGSFDVGAPDQVIASLAIAPSESDGQHWFDCAREKMF